jgi:phospholipid/cholesterol/gamma-HCH transport system ATP-binding protein
MSTDVLADEVVIAMNKVVTRFGSHVVHSGVDLQVRCGEIFAVIGGSGTGKSTLLREMILLQSPNAGRIQVLGTDLVGITRAGALALRQRFGVLFQQGGLFGALTVLENVGLPVREHRKLGQKEVDALAQNKLTAVGLSPEVANQYPSELSGGMLKRAALARALVLDPELLFLDEPTAGLDPKSAEGIDTLVRDLSERSGLTIVVVTHDLDLLWQVVDRVAVLADGTVQGVGSMAALGRLANPAIQAFFEGPRAQAAQSRGASAPASFSKESSSKPK